MEGFIDFDLPSSPCARSAQTADRNRCDPIGHVQVSGIPLVAATP
jgi:hypothetical protein